ncbi:ATP-binding protein [Spirillospora sp. CA-253888]
MGFGKGSSPSDWSAARPADGIGRTARPRSRPRKGGDDMLGAAKRHRRDFEIQFAAEAEVVAYGRRWLLDRLGEWGGLSPAAVDDAVLMFSETLTNGVVHGTGLFVAADLTFCRSHIEVGVRSQVMSEGPKPRTCSTGEQEGSTAECGRGLSQVVSVLADGWGWERALFLGRPGVRVWFRRRLT